LKALLVVVVWSLVISASCALLCAVDAGQTGRVTEVTLLRDVVKKSTKVTL
jgi:hypothetical protein